MMKTLTIFFAVMLCGSIAHAQNVHGNVGAEDSDKPGASKGDIGQNLVNVDLYTGTGSVNIPIYSHVQDGVNLDVSLGYSAKGIRVDELASSVGLGWNLNFGGGSITRQVMGIEDEVTLPTAFNGDLSDSLQGKQVPGAKNTNSQYIAHKDDLESDIFNLNIGGRSFEFGFDEYGAVHIYPQAAIKIQPVVHDVWTGPGVQTDFNWSSPYAKYGFGGKTGLSENNDITNFLVTDEKGNKFYFERGDYRLKMFKLDQGQVDQFSVDSDFYYVTDRWNIAKIVTHTGAVITYSYETTPVSYVEAISEVLNTKLPEYDWNANPVVVTYDPLEIREEQWVGVKSHVSYIRYPDGTIVHFDLDKTSNARCDCQDDFLLKNIKIESAWPGNPSIKNSLTYKLNHAYFNTPNSNYTANELTYQSCATIKSNFIGTTLEKDIHASRGLRLKLLGVEKIGTDNTTTEPYCDFEYNTLSLPYRFDPSKDFYGYYNGKSPVVYERDHLLYGPSVQESFALSIPYHGQGSNPNDPNGNWGLDRSYDFQYAKASVLTKINNSYGGQIDIEYQDYTLTNPSCGHGYSGKFDCNNNSVNCIVDPDIQGATVNDGLCVWKITNSERYSTEHNSVTEYTFSGGQRFFAGGYTWYPDRFSNREVYTNNFVAPRNYFNGSNHGFSEVTVTSSGFNNEQMLKTRYTFSNLVDDFNLVSCLSLPTGLPYHTMPGQITKSRMGLTLKVDTYDEDNRIIAVTENTYTPFAYQFPIYNIRSFGSHACNVSWVYNMGDYEMMHLTNTVFRRHVYSATTPYLSTYSEMGYTYGYDDKSNLKYISWENSLGETFRKYKMYNYDYLNQYGYNVTLDTMQKWGLQYKLSDEVWKMWNNGDSVLVAFDMITPLFNNSGGNKTVFFPTSFTAKINTPLSSPEVKSNGNYINKANAINSGHLFNINYGSHLERGSVVTVLGFKSEMAETKTANGIYISTIVDEITGNTIAKATNAKFDDIAFTSFENLYSELMVNYNQGRWAFDPSYIVNSPTAITGKYAYQLVNNQNELVKGTDLNEYMVSFWVKSSAVPTIKTYNGPVSVGGATPVLRNTVGDWKLYTAVVESDAGWDVKITNNTTSDMYIDEVRLHPVEATMVSYTYEPLFGKSSINNESNIISYYGYDKMGNHVLTKDMRGNILIKKERVKNGADNN